MSQLARRSRSWLPSALLLGAIAWACRVDPEEFHSRIYRCDISAADPACGTDIRGRPLQCFAARQLGASDFCVETCENGMPPMGDEGVCLASGAKLDACVPSRDDDPIAYPLGACGNKTLGCLRTDIVGDEGVCLPLRNCTDDADCRDPIRSVCAATILDNFYGPAANLKTDHLYCMQVECKRTATACAPGETCLLQVIPEESGAPDMCVPNCDSSLRCPPNHACFGKLYRGTGPSICVPGLLGFRCETTMDCIVGECVDTGDGFSICAPACASDGDCERFDKGNGPYLCASLPSTTTKHCVGASSFMDEICMTECSEPGERCVRRSPQEPFGICAPACEPDNTCKPRGGLAHGCVVPPPPMAGEPPQAPFCLPGVLGTPCASNAACIGTLGCQQLPSPAPKVCTFPCTSDAECAANRWAADGWCAPFALCMKPFEGGAECQRDAQCASRDCAVDPLDATKMRCAAVPPIGRGH